MRYELNSRHIDKIDLHYPAIRLLDAIASAFLSTERRPAYSPNANMAS
jgi:hypothetical protein